MKRTIQAELLDELPWDDAGARASRRDLVRLNRWMGNYRFLARQIRKAVGDGGVAVEVGAGEGQLADYLDESVCMMIGLDRAPRPQRWPGRWGWEQGDLFTYENFGRADLVIGSLVLHHFDEAALRSLGEKFQAEAKVLIFVEPARRWWGHGLALVPELTGLHPVTRHDMHVSIRGGFRAGEISASLGLDASAWHISEWEDWRGTVRMVACRI